MYIFSAKLQYLHERTKYTCQNLLMVKSCFQKSLKCLTRMLAFKGFVIVLANRLVALKNLFMALISGFAI